MGTPHAPPEGFRRLPPGVRCRCLNLWQESLNPPQFWCCNPKANDVAPADTIDPNLDVRITGELADRVITKFKELEKLYHGSKAAGEVSILRANMESAVASASLRDDTEQRRAGYANPLNFFR